MTSEKKVGIREAAKIVIFVNGNVIKAVPPPLSSIMAVGFLPSAKKHFFLPKWQKEECMQKRKTKYYFWEEEVKKKIVGKTKYGCPTPSSANNRHQSLVSEVSRFPERVNSTRPGTPDKLKYKILF